MRVLGILLCWYLAALCLWGQAKPTYFSARPQAGDGTYVFLRRYQLERHACNFELFYELNGLTKNSVLQLSRSYLLPIEQHTYNGQSIRTTLKIDDWQRAKQIQRYNQQLVRTGAKTNDFRKGKNNLWMPHHLRACPTDVTAFVPKDRNYEVLGKKYADVPLKDKQLAGAVYYIVAGHGGPDPGAMAKLDGHDLCEDEYAYDITLRLGRNLLEHGAQVHFIITDPTHGIRDGEWLDCDKSEVCCDTATIPLNQGERLQQRSDAINALYKENYKKGFEYQCLIEIHVDSRSAKERVDLFFYHYPDDDLSRQLGENLLKIFREKYKIHRKNGEYHGSLQGRDLHMLRETLPLSAFIEVGNMQNTQDQKRILLPTNRQAIADWLTEGLLKEY